MKRRVFSALRQHRLRLLSLSLLPLASMADANEVQAGFSQSLIIDDIVCEGNVTTECDFITKKYYQQVGEVLNPDEIADAKLRLGTLIQFKTINTRLAKGTQRGHVVVIFEVQEAQNLQYEIGGGYNYSKVSTKTPFCFDVQYSFNDTYQSCSVINGKSGGPSFAAAVTDFNFLGSGKQLSLGVMGARWDNGFTSQWSSPTGEVEGYRQQSVDDGGTRYTLAAEYYDPHLFDSRLYYFRARLNHTRNNYRLDGRLTTDMQEPYAPRGTSSESSTPLHLEVGRRFGSHSYVSADVGGYYTNTDDTNSIGINYGWDSQNDSLFPTKGSVFAASYRIKRQHIDKPTFAFSFKKHFELSENSIVSLGNTSLFAPVDRHVVYDSQFSSLFSARYTKINPIDKLAGIYSGWFTEVMAGITPEIDYNAGQISYGIRAGYTYQSDSMIMRFTLGFNHQERNP